MPYPSGLTLVPVGGILAGAPDGPAAGQGIAPPGIDADVHHETGAFTVWLPATDDPGYEPVGWQYEVVLRWGAEIIKGRLSVPRATVGTLNLFAALIVDQPPSPGLIDYLSAADVGVRVPSLVAGKIPAGQLPASAGGTPTWADLADKPATFPPAAHGHPIGQVDGLQAALDGKQPAGSYATTAALTATAGTLQTAIDGKQPAGAYAAAGHGHTVSQVDGLQAALDGKQPAGAYASAAAAAALGDRVTAVEDMTPVVMRFNGTAYVEAPGARIYVGPASADPGAVADGSTWIRITS
jgi:hypothetical protein